MATPSTGWRCTHSASVISYNNTSDTIRVICYWKNEGYTYSVNNVSAWVYCNGTEKQVKWNSSVNAPSMYAQYQMGYADFTIAKTTSAKNVSCYAKITSNSSFGGGTKTSSATSVYTGPKPSYTIKYNANGGTGAPGNQTKWYGTNLKLSTTKPTRTGHSFLGWATSASGSVAYQPGGTYSANAAVTLYAIWKTDTYTVSYDANGGVGAPENQTKTYGVDLELSMTIPTRKDYNFKGWGTSPSSTTVAYAAGATYKDNTPVTLYAIWELAYIKPRINNLTTTRCTSDGTANETGTYIHVVFDWSTDRTVTEVKIEYKKQIDSTWSSVTIPQNDNLNGSINEIIGDGNISAESVYVVRVYVADSNGSSYSSIQTIGTTKYPIDFYPSVNGGLGFGKVAEKENLADFGYNVKLGGGLSPIYLEPEMDLDDVKTPNFYTGNNVASNNYKNCPLTSGTFYLEVVAMGDAGEIRQRISSCNKTDSMTKERMYYENSWGPWKAADSNSLGVTERNTDLNNYTSTGVYYFNEDSTPLNAPSEVVDGWLSVLAVSPNTVKQIWYRTGTVNENDFETYVRTYNGSWSNWDRYLLDSETKPEIIWQGGYFMNAKQVITLPKKLSEYRNGIYLVWSGYDSGQGQHYNVKYTFVSKYHVSLGLEGVAELFSDVGGTYAFKYIYVYDDKITGKDENQQQKTKGGITYYNNRMVLRAVIGF